MIKVGIMGGAGYTAGELIRLLVNHPGVELAFVHSSSQAGKAVCEVHEGLIGDTGLHFSPDFRLDGIDLLFLCGAHGGSSRFLAENPVPEGLGIIDLAQDFRDESNGFVYGLPELYSDRISGAGRIANPGCFATAIQLALLPLALGGFLASPVQITAVTGSTGAGAMPSSTGHFSWRTGNLSTYKVFEHQHLAEIRRNLSAVSPRELPELNFVPVRGDFARGIFATLYTDCPLDDDALQELYHEFYRSAAFTFISPRQVDLKQVVNTNKCVLHVESKGGKAIVTAVIDNLLKGASGQAVQNMNIMSGLDESTGLRLKASAF